MSAVLVIARRELVERRMVFIAAAAFAVLALLVPFFPAVHGSARDVIAMSSIILAASFTLGLAAVLGANFVGRDVTAGRMSFYFARPVSGGAIWLGKLLAAALLIASSCLIVILPAVIAGGPFRSLTNEWAVIAFVWTTAAMFIVAHAGGTMIRSRSAMIALDFLALTAAIAAGWLIVWPLLEGGAIGALMLLAWSGSAVLLLAFIAAGAWQLIDGRTDRRRGHFAFSKVFWSAIALLLIVAGGFTAWIVTPSPSDLESPVMAKARGSHALVSGTAGHRFGYMPLFLVDLGSGKVERLGGAYRWFTEISRDGNRIVGVAHPSPTRTLGELYVRDVRPGAPWVDLHTTAGPFDRFAATDDASRIADLRFDTVTVYDAVRNASLGSAKVAHGTWWVYFATPDLLRMYSIDGAPHDEERTLRATEFDLRTRTLLQTGELPIKRHFDGLHANVDGSRLMVMTAGGSILCDARTLQPITNLPLSRFGLFLRDGRIATLDRQSLVIAAADGTPMKTIPLPAYAYPVEEPVPGLIVIAVWSRDLALRHVLTVDANHGVVRTEALAAPSYGAAGFAADPRPPAASAVQLMIDPATTRLVRWNALTGEKAPIE